MDATKKIRIKILNSPVREPIWKYKAAGLERKHFDEAEYVQFFCDYKNTAGARVYPYIYRIRSEIALSCCKRMWRGSKELILVPFDKCDTVQDVQRGKGE